jgi:curved DNA-binding protein
MEYKDYYAIMGVDKNATQDELKRAYRKLARKFHPDVSKEPDAEQKFKELGEAYEVLKDPEKRAAYDQLGTNWQAGQDFHPPPDWDAGFEFSGGGFTSGDSADYSDFFDSLFGHADARQTYRRTGGIHARGEDHHAKIVIDIEDAYHGATRMITLKVPMLDTQGHIITREHSLNVRIPKGIRQGQQIRLAGQGAPGIGDGKPGDLYLEVDINPHSLYRVDGRDLYFDLPLAPWEAALGAKVKIPTPQGAIDLTIPANSRAGRKLRLKGRGIPGNPAGDIYLVLQIALPAANTDEEKAIYREMEQKLAFNPRAGMGV